LSLTFFQKIAPILILLAFSLSVKAQFSEGIASGRPGNANGAFSVGKGVYQVQAGYNFTTQSLQNDEFADQFAQDREVRSTDAIFRIGIKEDFELRVFGSFVEQDQRDFLSEPSSSRSGLDRINVGVRQTLFQQIGVLPATAIQFTVDFGGLDEYQKNNPDAIFRLNFSNRLSSRFNLNYNASSRWRTDNSSLQGFFIVSLGYRITNKLSVTAESFSVINEESQTLNGGLGFAYFFSNHFMIDIYGSYGRNSFKDIPLDQELFNLSTGISYRIVNR